MLLNYILVSTWFISIFLLNCLCNYRLVWGQIYIRLFYFVDNVVWLELDRYGAGQHIGEFAEHDDFFLIIGTCDQVQFPPL